MLLTDKYADKIYGIITCYDRMIIQGYIAICAEQRPLVRLPAATRRSTTATLIKAFR